MSLVKLKKVITGTAKEPAIRALAYKEIVKHREQGCETANGIKNLIGLSETAT